jgi:hypothetical protein
VCSLDIAEEAGRRSGQGCEDRVQSRVTQSRPVTRITLPCADAGARVTADLLGRDLLGLERVPPRVVIFVRGVAPVLARLEWVGRFQVRSDRISHSSAVRSRWRWGLCERTRLYAQESRE